MCFFFKQKTAYEMRISDWSSDVCSSDLLVDRLRGQIETIGSELGVDFLQQFAELRQQPALGLGARLRCAAGDHVLAVHQREAGCVPQLVAEVLVALAAIDRKSTRLNASH